MPTKKLVAHPNHHHRTIDFTGAVLVFTACERKLTEAEELVHACDERMDMMWDEIRAYDA